MGLLTKLLRSEDGPTAVEYAVMLGMIIAVCVVSITLLGVLVSGMYDDSADRIHQAFSN
jgi:pilus assembly protein Flp/PilA